MGQREVIMGRKSSRLHSMQPHWLTVDCRNVTMFHVCESLGIFFKTCIVVAAGQRCEPHGLLGTKSFNINPHVNDSHLPFFIHPFTLRFLPALQMLAK